MKRHVHEHSTDIFYVIRGKGKFLVQNVGEVTLEPGTFAVIPPNTLHGVDQVEEELGALDVWSPSLL